MMRPRACFQNRTNALGGARVCDSQRLRQHLIELGAAPTDFVERVRLLSRHTCSHNRDSCRKFLSKHYRWLT